MPIVKRSQHNPILAPDPKVPWEAVGAYNPSVVEKDGVVHLLYRATSGRQKL